MNHRNNWLFLQNLFTRQLVRCSMKRRELLSGISVSSTVMVAGCLNRITGRCENNVEFYLVLLTEEEIPNEGILNYDQFSNNEKEIIDEAIQGRKYTECYPPSDEFSQLRSRIETTPYSDFATIRKDSDYFGVFLRVEDQVISFPPVRKTDTV